MSTAFTDEEKAFVRAILNNPGEMTGWLAYADWLTEHDDPRAEFIKLELRRTDPSISQTERFGVVAALEELQSELDPDWVAIFDRPAIENCDVRFAFKCPRKWEGLSGTDDPRVRECSACEKKVYYCLSLPEARDHARAGHCIALPLTVPHTVADLRDQPFDTRFVTLGIPARIERPALPPEPPTAPRRPWWKFW